MSWERLQSVPAKILTMAIPRPQVDFNGFVRGKTNTEHPPSMSRAFRLAHSGNARPGERRRRYVLYAIPLIALIGIAGAYALSVLPVPAAPAAVDYTFNLLVQISNNNSSNPQVRAVAPGRSIGEAGGYWATSQYNSYGVDSSHYPLYMDDPTTACKPYCVIHVKSTVARSYTLGDFFNVWGYPIGMNNTLGQKSYGNVAWEMCIGLGSGASDSSQWGAFVLQPDLDITLFFHDSSILGCAPS